MCYHLKYMDIRGRGEPIRWLLHVAGQEFTENRIPMQDWSAEKPKVQFQQVPVLMVDGKQLHQTTVISRYIGEFHNLSPPDLWTKTVLQEAVEALHDTTAFIAGALYARMLGKDCMVKEYGDKLKARLPIVLRNLEERVSPNTWICSDKMTWGDVLIACYLDSYRHYLPGCLKDYPKLRSLMTNVMALHELKVWIESRPDFGHYERPEDLLYDNA